ncbi:Uncharacterised protein [Mycobacteroides abscessus]|nr:Uncharacterised protein [Mycobacteroides abscessus]
MNPVRWKGKLVAAPLSALMLMALWLLPLSVVVSAVVGRRPVPCGGVGAADLASNRRSWTAWRPGSM